jgi:hypothetical protein
VSLSTVSQVTQRSASASALLAVLLCLIWAAPAHAGFVPALGSPFSYASPTQALSVADGDRNGTVDVAAGGLTLRRGNGTGLLGGPIAVGSTGAVEGLAGGDLNGDGLRDYVAIAPGSPRRLEQYLAIPGNGFAEVTLLEDAGAATDVAVANVNGDGLPDVVVVRDEADPNVTTILGGTLDVDTYESGIGDPGDVEVGDLTGEGAPDVVVAGDEASVAVLENAGDGTFAAGDLAPTGASGATRRIALTHLDGDGRLDLLGTDSAAPSAVVALRGDGGGGFQPLGRRATGLPGAPSALAVGDVDGDGPADVVAGSSGGRFAVLRSNGSGGLTPAPGSPFATGDPAAGVVEDVVATDMNRDGQPDVVTANRGGSVSVQLNDATGLLTASPGGIDYGTLLPFSLAVTRTVTLRSTRGRLRITRLDLQGSRLFSAAGNGCVGRTLLLGQACTVTVRFTPPRKAKRYEALLSFDANAPAVVVPLSAAPRPPIVRRPRLKRKRVAAGRRLDLRYRLSEGALVRVQTQRPVRGRRVTGECVAARPGNARRRRCTLWHNAAKVTRRDLAGPRRFRVSTRVKRRSLPPGLYRLSISAMDRFRNRSEEKTVRFRLLSKQRRAG